jgi:hypothetical protein
MSRFNGKLIAVLAILGALALVTGSGAFTTAQAQRTADVGVSGDASAALGLDTIADSPNSGPGGYATVENGELTISFENVNLDAVTTIDRVFSITNNGPQAVTIYIREYGQRTAAIDAGVKTSDLETEPFDEGSGPGGDGIAGPRTVDISNPGAPGYDSIGVRLDPGESIEVGLYIDTSDSNVNDGLDMQPGAGGEVSNPDATLWSRIRIYASAETSDARYEAA